MQVSKLQQRKEKRTRGEKRHMGKNAVWERKPYRKESRRGKNAPRQSAHLMMGSRRLSWSSNTWSGLRCGKRHDKNATPSCPVCGMMELCWSNQAWTIWVSELVTFEILFVRFCSRSLRRWHKRLYLKGILRVFTTKRGFYKWEDQEGFTTSQQAESPQPAAEEGQWTGVWVNPHRGPLIVFGLAAAANLFSLWEGIALPGCEDMANGKNVLLRQLWLQDETYRPINHDHCSNMRIRVAANGALSKTHTWAKTLELFSGEWLFFRPWIRSASGSELHAQFVERIPLDTTSE